MAAGVGARCALLNALEAAQTAKGRTGGQHVPETALALVTAALGELPRPVVDDILQDAPGADLAVLFASLSAWMLAHTTGGEQWLHRLGLAWARGGGE